MGDRLGNGLCECCEDLVVEVGTLYDDYLELGDLMAESEGIPEMLHGFEGDVRADYPK